MCSWFFRSRARGCPGAPPTAAMVPSPSTPSQRARGCRQPGQSQATPDTPDTKPVSGERESSKKSLPKRTQSEDITGPAKKAKVEHPIAPPMLPAEPPQIEPSAGANSTEPPATKAKIENAEQPGDNMHLQSDTPAGANSPTPPQLPQSPASDVARTVIDELEDSQVSQCEATDKPDSKVSQCEAADQLDSQVSQCEAADKLDKRKRNTLMVQTQNWLEDSSKGNWEQVGVGIYSSQSLLDQVLDPVVIMKGVWKEVIPRINKLLRFLEPLQFGANEDGERAYCAAWNKDHAKSAFRGPGFYLSSICMHWLDLQEQPGEFASWRNVMTCATEFWSKPNPHPPHLTGWVKDASIFDLTVMPASIKLRGSFELMAGLGLQLRRCTDEQLLPWKQMLRSMVITVHEDGPNSPLKGLAIKQATELGTLEQTQAVTPLGQAMMIHDMLDQIPGAMGPVRVAYDKMATWFSKQPWAPKEWGSGRYVCSALKVHDMFVKPPMTYKLLKKMNLMFGKAGLNDSINKLEAAGRTLDGNPESIFIFIKGMLYGLKRSEWTNIQSCTCINMTGRPDRGIISTPVVCLLIHHLAAWTVTHFEISQVVSSKLKDIGDFDMNFPCPKDFEQRGETVDQTWQHNVRDGKDTVAIDFLRDLHSGKLCPCLFEAYRRSPNWKDACKNPLPWLESLRGEPKHPSRILEYLDNLTNLHKTNKSFLAETVHLQPVPGPDCPGDTQSQEPAEDSQVSQNSGCHSSPEDVVRQGQEEACKAMMLQRLATTVRFVETSNSLSGNAVGAMLCGNSTIEQFEGAYKSDLKRAFIFDCVSIPEARTRPWRQVPIAAQEVKDRLSGIVTYLKAGDFLIFFDGGVKENSFMCHDVAMTAIRSGKQINWTDFSLVYKIEESSAWSRRRGFGCAANVETMVVVTVDYNLSSMQKNNNLLEIVLGIQMRSLD